jgi:hypothetical protein
VATISALAVTACFTTAQFIWPTVLEALRRDGPRFHSGQYWRLFTPILVHDDGWQQITFNFTAISIVGCIAERIYGPWRWLLFYLAAGLTGEIAGYRRRGGAVGGAIDLAGDKTKASLAGARRWSLRLACGGLAHVLQRHSWPANPHGDRAGERAYDSVLEIPLAANNSLTSGRRKMNSIQIPAIKLIR